MGKGAAIYVKNTLNHSACPPIDKTNFDCSAWCTVLLSDRKRLLVGVVYRSPNSTDDNNEKMLEVLRRASSIKADYLMVCGDFNLPKIDWNGDVCLDTETSFTARFKETIEDLCWFQHTKKDTRFRGSQSSCLDLVFTNEECMIDDIYELPPIGKSDHLCQKWEVTVSEVIYRNTTVTRPNFKRANWRSIKDDVDSFTLDPTADVESMMNSFLVMINNTKRTNIPICRPRSITVISSRSLLRLDPGG